MFKSCPKCQINWPSLQTFLDDPSIQLVGYQLSYCETRPGFLLFNHQCKGTLALSLFKFVELDNSPIYLDRVGDTSDDRGLCLEDRSYRKCPTRCECVYVSKITTIIENWQKRH